MNREAEWLDALERPDAYAPPVAQVVHLQTHISHVFLAGDFAYKIKKAVDLGFLDFSTVERRRFFCEEELRLNRRLAPDLYLEVLPVVRTEDGVRMGGEGEVLEYAVKMRRFEQRDLLSQRKVTSELIDRITAQVTSFHQRIEMADPHTPWGEPGQLIEPMLQNFRQIRELGLPFVDERKLGCLEQWTRDRHAALEPLLQQRKQEGFIRECHGDMHLGNMALLEGRLVIFDGIEFNPALRWIDVMSEVAFLVMDLEQAGQRDLAWRFLNGYLEITGDYQGAVVLDFYKLYRAMVRAKVAAIRASQADLNSGEFDAAGREFQRYLQLAADYVVDGAPRLMITHGVSGCGKSRLARQLRERLPAIHLRSDVERKRLAGLNMGARSQSAAEKGIYTPEATRRTYARLADLAELLLRAGYQVLVDATFLQREQRTAFRVLAAGLQVECVILDLRADQAVLYERVRARLAKGADPSEADERILQRQLAGRQPLDEDERRRAITADTSVPGWEERLYRQLLRNDTTQHEHNA